MPLVVFTPSFERPLYRSLGAGGAPEDITIVGAGSVTESFARLRSTPGAHVVLDLADCTTTTLQQLSATHAKRVVLVSHTIEREWMIPVMAPSFAALVARRTVEAGEIFELLQRIARRDTPGLEQHLGAGATMGEMMLTSSGQRVEAVDRMTSNLETLHLDERLITRAQTIVDEFLLNALYSAPTDAAGTPLFIDRDRRDIVSPPSPVRFRWGHDGTRIAVSVVDEFGSLPRRTLLRHVCKGFFVTTQEEIDLKRPGAGLGLAMALRAANGLIFNVQPNRRTECVGIVDVGGFRKLERQKSLRILFAGSEENG